MGNSKSGFPKPCLNPNGAVYTKTGGDNFVQLSCGYHNSIFQNTSRTPISECLWTRTIQSGKNSSSDLFTCKVRKIFFQILWKCRCDILVTFPSHLIKLGSILRFCLQKLICGFFHSFHSWKNTTKQLFQSRFQCRK